MRVQTHIRIASCTLGLVFAANIRAATPPTQSAPVISACNKPFAFGFGSWEKSAKRFRCDAAGVHIVAMDGKGGAGLFAGGTISLAGCDNWTPAITVAVTEQNKAGALLVVLQDADGTKQNYTFSLASLKPGQAALVPAEDGASLAAPQKVDVPGATPGLDLSAIVAAVVIGDWKDTPVDVVLSGITLVPPTAELLAKRAELKARLATETEKARLAAAAKEQARKALLGKAARHPLDGPEVRHVCAVAPDILSITLQAGR